MMATQRSEAISEREMVISRTLDAPRERVWEAWTNEEQVVLWWGPNGFRNTSHVMVVGSGGEWRYTMHAADGTDYENRIRYIEVVKPERLVYRHDDGTDNPEESFETTVTFIEREGKTVVTMRAVFASAEVRRRHIEEHGAVEGGNQTLGRLAAFLSGDELP
jgi:uncharacterized protein YndB with AHSA1/START domain